MRAAHQEKPESNGDHGLRGKEHVRHVDDVDDAETTPMTSTPTKARFNLIFSCDERAIVTLGVEQHGDEANRPMSVLERRVERVTVRTYQQKEAEQRVRAEHDCQNPRNVPRRWKRYLAARSVKITQPRYVSV